MRKMILATCLLPLAACATSGSDQAGVPALPPPLADGGPCKPDGLGAFVGREATTALGAEMLRVSGARTMRWGGPDTAMTMDLRPDRLTVLFDARRIITSARCE